MWKQVLTLKVYILSSCSCNQLNTYEVWVQFHHFPGMTSRRVTRQLYLLPCWPLIQVIVGQCVVFANPFTLLVITFENNNGNGMILALIWDCDDVGWGWWYCKKKKHRIKHMLLLSNNDKLHWTLAISLLHKHNWDDLYSLPSY